MFFLILLNISIIYQIPGFQQFFAFIGIIILPGYLIANFFNFNKFEFFEKLIFYIIISLSFIIFFYLFINFLGSLIGLTRPLSQIAILLSYNFFCLGNIIFFYIRKKDYQIFIKLPIINRIECKLIVLSIFAPLFSVLLKLSPNDNFSLFILGILILIIVALLVIIIFTPDSIPDIIFPIILFSISVSILILIPSLSDYIIGTDANQEFYYFLRTIGESYWTIFDNSLLTTCLSVTLLPSVIQNFFKIDNSILFKFVYSAFYSISPLIVYYIGKKFFKSRIAFFAGIAFIIQYSFLQTTLIARTSIAILFFSMVFFLIFEDRLDNFSRTFLIIIFLAGGVVSHYSTSYIFLFILVLITIYHYIYKKFRYIKFIGYYIPIILFLLIIFWYGQISSTAFDAGINLISITIDNFQNFFAQDIRTSGHSSLIGVGFFERSLPYKIEFLVTWTLFFLICIGTLKIIHDYYKQKQNINETFLILIIICDLVLAISIILPIISLKYDIMRIFPLTFILLSSVLIVGSITISQFLLDKFAYLKSIKNLKFINTEEYSKFILILALLSIYLISITGFSYNLFEDKRVLIFTQKEYERTFNIHDQESAALIWFSSYRNPNLLLNVDMYGKDRVFSHTGILAEYPENFIDRYKTIERDYLFLRYYNINNNKIVSKTGFSSSQDNELSNYKTIIEKMNIFYSNGGSSLYIGVYK